MVDHAYGSKKLICVFSNPTIIAHLYLQIALNTFLPVRGFEALLSALVRATNPRLPSGFSGEDRTRP